MAQSFGGEELFYRPRASPPLVERPRAAPLDVSAPETIDAWVAEGGGRTLAEFARAEQGFFKPNPPPAPPGARSGTLKPSVPSVLGEGIGLRPIR